MDGGTSMPMKPLMHSSSPSSEMSRMYWSGVSSNVLPASTTCTLGIDAFCEQSTPYSPVLGMKAHSFSSSLSTSGSVELLAMSDCANLTTSSHTAHSASP